MEFIIALVAMNSGGSSWGVRQGDWGSTTTTICRGVPWYGSAHMAYHFTCWSLLNLWISSMKRMVFLLNILWRFPASAMTFFTSATLLVVADNFTSLLLESSFIFLAMIPAKVVCDMMDRKTDQWFHHLLCTLLSNYWNACNLNTAVASFHVAYSSLDTCSISW